MLATPELMITTTGDDVLPYRRERRKIPTLGADATETNASYTDRRSPG